MGSLGFGSGSGSGAIDALQDGWNKAVEGDMRVMDARQEILKGVIEGTATALRRPMRSVIWCAAIVAIGVVGLLAVEIVRAVGVTRTCTIVLPSGSGQSR